MFYQWQDWADIIMKNVLCQTVISSIQNYLAAQILKAGCHPLLMCAALGENALVQESTLIRPDSI